MRSLLILALVGWLTGVEAASITEPASGGGAYGVGPAARPAFSLGGTAVSPAGIRLTVPSSAVSVSSVIDLELSHRLLGIHTLGHYDNEGLGTWNGQPLSEDNRPSEFENQLEADWDAFVEAATPNVFFLRVTNIADTHYGSIFGPPFDYVALTGFTLQLPTRSGVPLPSPMFSNEYAIPGQELNGYINGNTTETLALDETPGWEFTESPPGHYIISTATVAYAFSHFGNIFGSTRIRVGGLLRFEWPAGTNLRQEVRWADVIGTADHGLGRYQAPGELTFVAELPDSDDDGMIDEVDNCPTVANTDQLDRDHDLLGDACDAFPDDADNEQAQCEADLGVCQQNLAVCESKPVPDADGDGETNATDRCPDTAAGEPVDDAGCSRAQFCAQFDTSTKDGGRACRKADWRNDEPTMRGRDRDCDVVRYPDRTRCEPIAP